MNLVLYIESIYKLAWREPNRLDGKEGFFPMSIWTLFCNTCRIYKQVGPKSWSGS